MTSDEVSRDINEWYSGENPYLRRGHPEDIEQLHPDLRPYVIDHPTLGLSIKHPLHFQIMGVVWKMANALYEQKVKALAKAEAERDWYKWIVLHERPYRLTALATLFDSNVITAVEMRPLLADFWTDAEYPAQHGKRLLLRLFKATGFITDDPESDVYLAAEPPSTKVEDRLPEEVTIYRGQPIGERPGLSWTTDMEMGAWFARRYRTEATALLLKATVKREKVLGYFEGRGEHEVVVNPRSIKNLTTIDLPPVPAKLTQPGFPKITVKSAPEGTVVTSS